MIARAQDELLLAWLAARAAGVNCFDVAAASGVGATMVRTLTNQVRSADLAESGEARRVVLAGYW